MEQPQDNGAPAGNPPVESQPGRYSSLADYLRVLRRRKWLILASTVALGVLAAGMSINQEKVYEATTQLTFRDPLADLDLLPGVDRVAQESPVVKTAAEAELITRPEVTRIVRRKLDGELNADELQVGIDTQIGVQTNIVNLTASFGDPEIAARVANAYAEAVQRVELRESRQRLKPLEESLEDQIDAVRDRDLEPGLEALELLPLQQALRQVQTADVIAEPVTIAQRAVAPDGAASPATRRNTALGLLLGLVLGIGAAFVRDTLDRRLHSVHQVHETTGAPILSRVPVSAFGYAGLARSSNLVMLDSDFEAFRGLRMNLAALSGSPPRSVLVTSAVEEEGKSTVSMGLASAAALAEQRVLLVECDLRRPVFARRLGLQDSPGLTDYLSGRAGPADILQTVPLRNPATLNDRSDDAVASLVAIAAGTSVPNPAELLVGARFRSFLEKVSRAYDLVVLDSPPALAVVDPVELASVVDGIIVCVRLRRTTTDQLQAVRSAVGQFDRPMGAVVTGIKRSDPDSYDYYYG